MDRRMIMMIVGIIVALIILAIGIGLYFWWTTSLLPVNPVIFPGSIVYFSAPTVSKPNDGGYLWHFAGNGDSPVLTTVSTPTPGDPFHVSGTLDSGYIISKVVGGVNWYWNVVLNADGQYYLVLSQTQQTPMFPGYYQSSTAGPYVFTFNVNNETLVLAAKPYPVPSGFLPNLASCTDLGQAQQCQMVIQPVTSDETSTYPVIPFTITAA